MSIISRGGRKSRDRAPNVAQSRFRGYARRPRRARSIFLAILRSEITTGGPQNMWAAAECENKKERRTDVSKKWDIILTIHTHDKITSAGNGQLVTRDRKIKRGCVVVCSLHNAVKAPSRIPRRWRVSVHPRADSSFAARKPGKKSGFSLRSVVVIGNDPENARGNANARVRDQLPRADPLGAPSSGPYRRYLPYKRITRATRSMEATTGFIIHFTLMSHSRTRVASHSSP